MKTSMVALELDAIAAIFEEHGAHDMAMTLDRATLHLCGSRDDRVRVALSDADQCLATGDVAGAAEQLRLARMALTSPK